jgi:hydrogenase expression/formation protein HypC
MCLAIPGLVRSVDVSDPAQPVAKVDFEGQLKTVSLLYVPEATVGDYVIVQAGFAIRLVNRSEALEALALARETTVDGIRTTSAAHDPPAPMAGGGA